jgi:hypothetical protein
MSRGPYWTASTSAVGPAGPGSPQRADAGQPPAPANTLAWLSAGSGIFSVDGGARTVRYRGCDGDTGRVVDQSMKVTLGVATGRVKVADKTYAGVVALNDLQDHWPWNFFEIKSGRSTRSIRSGQKRSYCQQCSATDGCLATCLQPRGGKSAASRSRDGLTQQRRPRHDSTACAR